MKKILTLSFLLLGFISRGELLQYNVTSSARATGDGHVLAMVVRGLMIYDTDNGSFALVGYGGPIGHKYYTVETKTDYQTVQVTGPTSIYTVLVNSIHGTNQTGKVTINSDIAKGVNRTLKTATGRTFVFPSVMAGINNRSIFPVLGDGEWLIESNDTFAFNTAKTVLDNDQNLTTAQIVANFSTYLESRGYQHQ